MCEGGGGGIRNGRGGRSPPDEEVVAISGEDAVHAVNVFIGDVRGRCDDERVALFEDQALEVAPRRLLRLVVALRIHDRQDGLNDLPRGFLEVLPLRRGVGEVEVPLPVGRDEHSSHHAAALDAGDRLLHKDTPISRFEADLRSADRFKAGPLGVIHHEREPLHLGQGVVAR
jgi:hypothetical protein